MRIRERLEELGLEIPPAQVVPEGVQLTYRRLVRHGDTAYVAGHGPTWGEGWGSKLGKMALIRHATPDSLDGPDYGKPYAVYYRKKAERRAA